MAKIKILVVDDDEIIIKSLGSALVAEGYEVVTASDGKEGLTKALNETPRLILLDLEMPVLDGMGMLRELRKSGDWGEKVPVIILTNFDTTEEIMKGIVENKPSFYVLKSKASPSQIIEKIKEKVGSANS